MCIKFLYGNEIYVAHNIHLNHKNGVVRNTHYVPLDV